MLFLYAGTGTFYPLNGCLFFALKECGPFNELSGRRFYQILQIAAGIKQHDNMTRDLVNCLRFGMGSLGMLYRNKLKNRFLPASDCYHF